MAVSASPKGSVLGGLRLRGGAGCIAAVGGRLLADGLLGGGLVDQLGKLGLTVLAVTLYAELRGDLVKIAQRFALECG